MASCKDCLHYEACESQVPRTFWNSETFYYHCKCFKDRTRFVELPCNVDDTVYVKMQFGGYAEAEVRDYSYFISCGFCIVVTSKKFDKQHIPFSEFGKTVFLTREEAERALKERDNNG